MIKPRFLVTILLALVLSRPARANPPAWCATEGVAGLRSTPWEEYARIDDTDDKLIALVQMTCNPFPGGASYAGNDRHREAIDAARESLAREVGLTTDNDWVDLVAFAQRPQNERKNPHLDLDQKRPWSSYDAIDQYTAIRSSPTDVLYLVDALDEKLTETGRLAYVQECLGDNPAHEVHWALCQQDVTALDPAKVLAELRADTRHGGYERTSLRLELHALRQKLPKHAARVKELLAKDDAYPKLFEIVATARKEWDAKKTARAPLLELAMAMDDARVTHSRKALAACGDRAWPAWQAAVSAIPAKRFEHMHDHPRLAEQIAGVVVGEPDGYLAAIALHGCEADRPDQLTFALGQALQRWPGSRGPRNQALTAVLGAGLELDDRSEKLEYPSPYREWFGTSEPAGEYGAGALASVSAAGDKVTLTFVKRLEKQVQCTSSRRTNRIVQILPNGTLVYQEICTGTATVTVDRASPPRTVDARYTKGLKSGMIVSVEGAIVEAVWAREDATMPSMVCGAPVK